MKNANIGISEENKQILADQLSKILADEFLLYSKTLDAHWNIEGPDFHTVHVYFETLYNEQQGIVDTVAEKIRAIGHYVPAQLSKYLQLTHLSERTRDKNDSLTLFAELLEDHESIIFFFERQYKTYGRQFKSRGNQRLHYWFDGIP